ncbi:MAG: efflux RND transporter periplasmic adaptor subunit [Oscillospiraceae bacterium]|nr:efflux RND transporter periplasmic adaptor subunit [Oscillospiraceae bacterium]
MKVRYTINTDSRLLRVIALVVVGAIVLSIAACVAINSLASDAADTANAAQQDVTAGYIGAEEAPAEDIAPTVPDTVAERVIAVNTSPVQLDDIRTVLSFTGQIRASSQVTIMSRLQGIVDEVFVNVGDFVYEGDVLFTMDESDVWANIRALDAQLGAADAAVSAAQTGVSLAGGSQVQGQILQARGAITQAEAGVVQAESGVLQAEAGILQAEANVEQAEMGIEQRALAVRQAEMAHADAVANLESMAILLEFGDISQIQYDQAASGANNAAIGLEQARSAYEMAHVSLAQAQNGVEQARNGLDQARAGVSMARNSVSQAQQNYRLVTQNVAGENRRRAEDGLAQAEAQRAAQEVNLAAARDRLDDAVITSPITGVISSRSVEPRTMLLSNAPPITIVSIDEVIVHVNVTETIVNRIANGQRIRVNIPAASDEPFEGEVITVSPTADPMTQTFSVEVSLDNSHRLLRPGMFAEAFFVRFESNNTMVVPRGAVLMDGGQTVVFVVEYDEQGVRRAVRREVTVGIDSGPEIEIVSGIAQGENLIVTGQSFVRDGSPVVVGEDGGAAN